MFESWSRSIIPNNGSAVICKLPNKLNGARPEQFKMHIVRTGGFHTLNCFIAAIGKLWGDGGLKDLVVDSDVYAGSTDDLMLAGKQFHHAVRGLTLLYPQPVFLICFL